jgi:hypothetical protein
MSTDAATIGFCIGGFVSFASLPNSQPRFCHLPPFSFAHLSIENRSFLLCGTEQAPAAAELLFEPFPLH